MTRRERLQRLAKERGDMAATAILAGDREYEPSTLEERRSFYRWTREQVVQRIVACNCPLPLSA